MQHRSRCSNGFYGAGGAGLQLIGIREQGYGFPEAPGPSPASGDFSSFAKLEGRGALPWRRIKKMICDKSCGGKKVVDCRTQRYNMRRKDTS